MVSQLSPPPLATLNFKQIETLLENSSDSDRVLQYLGEFSARYPKLWEEIANDPERSHWLVAILNASHFLSEELLKRPEWLSTVTGLDRTLGREDYDASLANFREQAQVPTTAAQELAFFRRRELLRIVLRDILNLGGLAEITEELSNLADAIIASALKNTLAEFENRYGRPENSDSTGPLMPSSFAVVALGKLGGRELNYSSDIDLMFLYSDNGDTAGPHKITNKEFFNKVANHLTNILSTYTPAGICYRVDLRLRPEGTLGDVCISLDAAKDYYAKRARDWELQMLIKARVAAGDQALGQALLDFVEPLIYSSTLEFSSIEAMSATRERISEKLVSRRLKKDGIDVKLTRGGIRDIEFLVQCLQRLHGGRDRSVRYGGTLLALSRLHEHNLLADTEYSRLRDAYEFLRTLEHRLQFENDNQTHMLPTDPAALDRLARRISDGNFSLKGLNPSVQLLKILNQHLENVQHLYESIVHAQRPLYYTPSATYYAVSDVHFESPENPARKELSGDLIRLLEGAAPNFAERLRKRGFHGSEQALASFLEKVTEQPECLELLNAHGRVSDWVMQIFELSPFLAEQLARRPELMSDLPRVIERPDARPAFESAAPPLRDVDGLRRFFRREMFCIQAASICGPTPVFQTLDRTSALAEFVIARAYRSAKEQAVAHAHAHASAEKPFRDPKSDMMVVTLGRLGMREFDLASDADLLFIIPDSEAQRQRFWTRLTEHLIEILTAYTEEGPILSIDTRLRPDGREGMLVQTESKYVDYFGNRAEAWEGIAYMKARGVAGDTRRATKFLKKLQEVDWRRYGQSRRSKEDLRQMRLRLQREQGTVTPLKAAQGGYYDADFILMYLRLKGAGLFFKSLNTPERIDIVEKMGHLEQSDAEFLLEATTFFRALDHAIRIVSGRAEERIPPSDADRGRIAELVRRWTNERIIASTLETELETLRAKMRRLFERVFGM